MSATATARSAPESGARSGPRGAGQAASLLGVSASFAVSTPLGERHDRRLGRRWRRSSTKVALCRRAARRATTASSEREHEQSLRAGADLRVGQGNLRHSGTTIVEYEAVGMGRATPRSAHVVSIIGFISDFGLEDTWVGVCHAVIYRACPLAHVVDLGHQIPPFDIRKGAATAAGGVYQLPEAIHLSSSTPASAEADATCASSLGTARGSSDPDNGVLLPAAARAGGSQAGDRARCREDRPRRPAADVPRPRRARAGGRRARVRRGAERARRRGRRTSRSSRRPSAPTRSRAGT